MIKFICKYDNANHDADYVPFHLWENNYENYALYNPHGNDLMYVNLDRIVVFETYDNLVSYYDRGFVKVNNYWVNMNKL